MESILVASRKKEAVQKIHSALSSDYAIKAASDLDVALGKLREKQFAFFFLDTELIGKSDPKDESDKGLQLIWNLAPRTEIIAVSSKESIREAVSVVKAGAADYITHPVDPAEVKLVVESTRENLALRSELDYLRDRFWQSNVLEIIQTKNSEMKSMYERVRKVAATKTTVLLTGETGTGKGVLARLIHRHSNRGDNQFISVHCGAIPDTLLESELFGHEKGAFTGATRRKLGKFEIAHGGTIFLDEIGTLTPSAQIKLLQVLQDGTFQRVGGEKTIQVNIRVISATNMDLEESCNDGRFRKDLYYRVNVFPIEIPSLRKRAEDIPQLADLFLKRQEKGGHKGIRTISPEVMASLKKYPWPGNIRELENIIERAYVLGSEHALSRFDFPEKIMGSGVTPAAVPVNARLSLAEMRHRAVEVAESSYLREILAVHKGKLKDAAETAGITTRQLHKLLKKYDIRKETFKVSAVSSKKQES